MQMARSGGEPGVKGLYAAAALVRNNATAQAVFHRAGGRAALESILAGECSLKLQKKAVALAMDLTECSTGRVSSTACRACRALACLACVLASLCLGVRYHHSQ